MKKLTDNRYICCDCDGFDCEGCEYEELEFEEEPTLIEPEDKKVIWKLHLQTPRFITYKKSDGTMTLSAVFDLFLKNVSISLEALCKQRDDKGKEYNYWQALSPSLQIEDLEFILSKSKKLFVEKRDKKKEDIRKGEIL